MATDSGGQAKSNRQHADDANEAPIESTGGERREKLSEDVDAILDDIDAVLETNPQEFVLGYVQKGGQ